MGFKHFFSRIFSGNKEKKPAKFIVTGTANSYLVTYKKCDDSQAAQLQMNKKKWKYSFTAKPGDYVYVSAQSNEKNKSVNVEIIYDHKTFLTSSQTGDYAIATVSGTL